MFGEWGLQVFLEPLPKCFIRLSIIIMVTVHFNPYIIPLLSMMVSMSLGATRRLSNLLMLLCSNSMSLAYVLDAFTGILCVLYYYVASTVLGIFSAILPAHECLFSLGNVLIVTLFCAHVKYLRFWRPKCKCSFSVLNSSGVDQSSLALCVRVLMMLY